MFESAGGVSGRVRLIVFGYLRAGAVLAAPSNVCFGVKAMNMSFQIITDP